MKRLLLLLAFSGIPFFIYSQYSLGFSQFVSTCSVSNEPTAVWVLGDIYLTSLLTSDELWEQPVEPVLNLKVVNPVREMIQLISEADQALHLFLYNLKGQYLIADYLEAGISDHTISISQFPAGTYILHVRTSDGKLTGNYKIIKQ